MSDESDGGGEYYVLGHADGYAAGKESALDDVGDLVAKARKLVEMLDDAEVNHGSLVGGVTLRARDELRLELSRWPK